MLGPSLPIYQNHKPSTAKTRGLQSIRTRRLPQQICNKQTCASTYSDIYSSVTSTTPNALSWWWVEGEIAIATQFGHNLKGSKVSVVPTCCVAL